jgi:TetR/AcrR family transcriptional regulator
MIAFCPIVFRPTALAIEFGHLYNYFGHMTYPKREPRLARAARATRTNDTPERILEAALETFSQKGFDGARTRDIAARADVTLGLVQYHFGTKAELWKAAVECAFKELAEGLDRVVSNPGQLDERDLLREMIRAHIQFVAHHTEFIRIMHDEGKCRGPRMRWLTDRYVRPLFDQVVPVISRAQASGILASDVDPTHFVYALLGAAGMIFHQAEECKRLTGIQLSDPAVVEAHSRTVESLFLGPNKPQALKDALRTARASSSAARSRATTRRNDQPAPPTTPTSSRNARGSKAS